ncbi:MAG TPA: D-alanyl-D-alanine carboxypeptidase family protein [Kiritimatiellia bacterium]|nr:D-alanyl-D-alanine carboxypeptidase family protein [Kiritimatiellia bacterium]
MKKILFSLALIGLAVPAACAQSIARDPYNGAIVVDASDGRVLFEDGADRPGYPASMLKLMDLFVILDRVKAGQLRLDETVAVTKEAFDMGGSQVWLDPRETFPLEELLYALMVQSANDAAMALAIHVGGSREGFVRLMNQKARELGLSPVTQFQSPHGLPPAAGQRPDMTTPRDFAKLCQALLAAHPETLKYTSVIQRPFRPDAEKPVIMGNHNALLGTFPGCDGLKTGWIRASGYCLAATVQRDGRRVISVVMGSATKSANIAKTKELINRCLPDATRAAAVPPPQPAVQPAPAPAPAPVALDDSAQGEELDQPAAEPEEPAEKRGGWLGKVGYVLLGAFLAAVVGLAVQRRLLLR